MFQTSFVSMEYHLGRGSTLSKASRPAPCGIQNFYHNHYLSTFCHIHSFQYSPWNFMEINIGISECDRNVDYYYGRNIGSHTVPAKRLSTVSSPFMVVIDQKSTFRLL